MNTARIKCLLAFCVFAIVGFGPVSVVCLIGFYVLAVRPPWFLDLTRRVYADIIPSPPAPGRHPTVARLKCFLCLLVLFILDIAPVPVTSGVAFAVLLARPLWFYEMVETVYS